MIIPGVSKHQLLAFVRSLGEKDCHMALLGPDADYNCMTGTFTGAGEVKAKGYAAGGKKLQGFSYGLDDGIAWCAWGNPEWMNATIRATGAVIYSKTDNSIVTVVEFDGEQRSTQGLFRVKMPPAGPENAVFWLS